MKVFAYLLAELFFIGLGGCVVAWIPVRGIPAGEGALGHGMGMVLFGTTGMFAGGIIGVLTLVIFWEVTEMRAQAAAEKRNAEAADAAALAPAGTIWPPTPKP